MKHKTLLKVTVFAFMLALGCGAAEPPTNLGAEVLGEIPPAAEAAAVEAVTAGDVEVNAANFPDEVFRDWILRQDYGADGVLTPEEIAAVTVIDMNSPCDISSLAGIKYFTSLRTLVCNYQNLSDLDLSRMTSLTRLECSHNSLTRLDLSGLSSLESLWCGSNLLTSLDLSELTLLRELVCNDNSLTTLNLSGLSSLTRLQCGSNNLTTLDLSGLSSLSYFACTENKLTTLDLSGLSSLSGLECGTNSLTALDLSGLSSLTRINCSSNNLSSLDLSGLTSLNTLLCYDNELSSLDLSGLTLLYLLRCDNNRLTSLDLSEQTFMNSLICYGNKLTSLDLSGLTSLELLYSSSLQKFIWTNGSELTLQFEPTDSGTVMSSFIKSDISMPLNISLYAIPENGYKFLNWSGYKNDSYPEIYPNIGIFEPDLSSDITLVANFSKIPQPEPPVQPIENAGAPIISRHPQDVTPTFGKTAALTAEAYVIDGGTISVQWYYNTENANSGGKLIPGATGNSYSPPTSAFGTTYYYAVFTNTNGTVTTNKSASTATGTAAVIVSQRIF